MSSYSYPPMFTNYGYVPSIFMDTSPKQPHWATGDGRWQSSGQELANVVHHDGSRTSHASGQRLDYIQIWLDAHPVAAEVEPEYAPSPVPPSPVPSAASTDHSSAGSRAMTANRSARESCEDGEDDSMEWESCLSSSLFSPMSRSVPDVDERSTSPSPQGSQHHRVLSPEPESAPSARAPIMMAFRQHALQPRLLLQGRSPCIFLGQDAPLHSRVHRRVNDLLHNASIQRIRSWFKTLIEPNALEQWRNVSLLHHLRHRAVVPDPEDPTIEEHNCPICFKTDAIMKQLTVCGHKICWKCEQYLDRAGNISCPLCRRIRVLTTFTTLEDLFQCTIGLHPADYIHPLRLQPPHHEGPIAAAAAAAAAGSPSGKSPVVLQSDAEELERMEHELSDRYLWEPSASFLEYLQSAPYHPAHQYFQLNAVQDLCDKSSTDGYLSEYNDRTILEPPTSGLLLPPHRLYIALIHFCLDMLTLPNPAEFQNQRRFQREKLLLQLVILFLVPTDEFSPRASDRIFDVSAWIEHGQFMLGRLHRFMETKAVANLIEMEEAAAAGRGLDNPAAAGTATPLRGGRRRAAAETAVPSSPIPRHILYLGSARWNWISQSLTVLVSWIKAAQSNPSMVPLVEDWQHEPLLGKHARREQQDEVSRPTKRRRTRKRLVEDETGNSA
ncbi:unnamed protein product [Mortierella alpina]